MNFEHVPVMLRECLEALQIKAEGTYVDGTVGGAGHAGEIFRLLSPEGQLIGLDRDSEALAAADERLRQIAAALAETRAEHPAYYLLKANYGDMPRVLKELEIDKVDGILLDLGISSYQIDNPQRGFSYMHDVPLDMRMDQDESYTAADLLNTAPEGEITRILREYAEEKWAARIAKIICEKRAEKPLATTGDLVACVDAAIPKAVRRKDDGHPARRTFQAIRIAVNDELDPLDKALCDFVELLKPGGRLCVITFHSLEDRIVKRCFQRLQNPCTCPPSFPVCVCGKKPQVRVLAGGAVKPSKEEIERNPRAHSAILRVCEKLEVR